MLSHFTVIGNITSYVIASHLQTLELDGRLIVGLPEAHDVSMTLQASVHIGELP